MRSSSSPLWGLQRCGGDPGATATDDMSDASEVDSWYGVQFHDHERQAVYN